MPLFKLAADKTNKSKSPHIFFPQNNTTIFEQKHILNIQTSIQHTYKKKLWGKIMIEQTNLITVPIKKPEEINFILGQTHFIKTVEDLYETMTESVPGAQFGIAFCEASGACKIRVEGNDETLKKLAAQNAQNIAAGHTFIIMMKNCFPINVLNAVKNCSEVCTIFCATANPTKVILAESTFAGEKGRGILGVIDGFTPKGIETNEDKTWRKKFLRDINYKL